MEMVNKQRWQINFKKDLVLNSGKECDTTVASIAVANKTFYNQFNTQCVITLWNS